VPLKPFDLPKFMETLEGNAQNPSTIIALKLAGFKTREQQLEKFSEVSAWFDLTADFKAANFLMRVSRMWL
jgi:hypothetical protein